MEQLVRSHDTYNQVNLLTNSSTTSNYYNHTMSAATGQSLSTALTVISANIGGLTAVKASILLEMCKGDCRHCLCLQETHRSTNLPRPMIAGMSLVVDRPHNKYGSAMLLLFAMIRSVVKSFKVPGVEVVASRMSND